jgi:branched-chain amino acid transport system permease protein
MDASGSVLLSGLIDGVTIGSVYALMAIGFSVVYGITRVFNLGYGSFFTWGAYIVWFLPVLFRRELPYSIKFAIFIPTMFAFGWFFERIVVRPARKSPNWAIIVCITTLASGLVLDTAALVTFGPMTKTVPPLFEGNIALGGFVIKANDIVVFVMAMLAVGLLALFLYRTRVGTAMRAVAQDLTGARMVGIYVNKIFGYSFGISAVLAGIAGILLAPKYFICPMGGWEPFIKAFVVVILGGLGSFKGTVCAAFLLGIVEALVVLYIAAVWVMPVWFVILIALLIIRPRGLFGVRE